MRFWLSILVAIAAMFLCSTVYGGDKPWEVTGLTDVATSKLEARVGYHLDDQWTLGFLGTWYAEASPVDWSVGGYAKLTVDPNATIPLADWFPAIGEWLDLPETIQAETYLIGKVEIIPYEEGIDLSASPGAGFSVGPFVLEYLYRLVESGDSDQPFTTSGPELWFGARLQF